MAIIKCPECGHQISDKAPVCPSCGVEIAGKVTKCPQCGEVYFKDQAMCPVCHHPNELLKGGTATRQKAQQAVPPTPPARPQATGATGGSPAGGNGNGQPAGGKKNHWVLPAVAFAIAAVLCGVMFYYYHSAKTDKEQEAYEYAMKSDDPLVLQSYLDTYKDFNDAHNDSIRTRLTMLQQMDQEWDNALVSNSKAAFEAYLGNHPGTPHEGEIRHKIDSIDWAAAGKANSVDAFQAYLEQHPDGEHFEEANDNIKQLKADTVQPEEEETVKALLRKFFQSINNKSASGITETVSGVMASFLGKTNATADDVVTFMEKQWQKDGLKNLNWYIKSDYDIQKKEIGEDKYDYTVTFTAVRKTAFGDASKDSEDTYRITAHVNQDGEISSMSMVKY